MTRKAGILFVTAILFCSFSMTGKAQMHQPDYSDPGYWLSMIEEWRKAVEQHRPGEADAAAVEIGSWPTFELEFSLALFKRLIARPLYELAIPTQFCRSLASYLGLKREEDKNYWLKRGALLHADIALLQLETGTADPYRTQIASITRAIINSRKRQEKTCWSIRLLTPAVLDLKDKGSREMAWIQDGRSVLASEGRHMEFGRFLLDAVTPKPSTDEMVRQWYIATAAYGLSRGRTGYIERHLQAAVNIFPSDALILFYAGMLHETYSTPRYQNALQIRGVKYPYGAKKSELELARQFFQRAVKADPNFAEARLRLGRASGLLGGHKQAVSELQQAAAAITDPQMLYFGALFLGNEQAMLGRKAEAREQFELAARFYPTAQSPLLAQSQLAYSNGTVENAWIALEQVFAAAAKNSRPEDPRWRYDLVPEHKAATLIMEMRKIFGEFSR